MKDCPLHSEIIPVDHAPLIIKAPHVAENQETYQWWEQFLDSSELKSVTAEPGDIVITGILKDIILQLLRSLEASGKAQQHNYQAVEQHEQTPIDKS